MAESRAPAGEAADWLTIWQSEMSAMAQDRELAEAWLRWASATKAAAARMQQMAAPAGGTDAAPGRARTAAPAGTAPAMAAFGGGDAALDALARRVAALERERDAGSDGAGAGGVDQRHEPGT